MDKKIAGLLGAAVALTTVGAVTTASAATSPTTESLTVTSYRDLLDPVLNPVEALKADDARLAEASSAPIEQAQYRYHHHHHHHHNQDRRRFFRRFVPPPFRRDHHHHHHHHHMAYYRG
jgi:hypothetical protein